MMHCISKEASIRAEKLDVLSGVPQGTVLAPSFLVYINALPSVCKSSQANLFVDDILLYRHTRNDGESIKLQEDLSAQKDWSSNPSGRWLSIQKSALCWKSQKASVTVEKLTISSMVNAFKPQPAPNIKPNILVWPSAMTFNGRSKSGQGFTYHRIS